MRSLLDFIFRPRRNPRYNDLKKHGIYDALRISLIVCPAVAFAVTLFLVMSYVWPESYRDVDILRNYRFYYYMMLFGLILYEALLFFTQSKFERRYRILPLVNTVVTATLLWWSGQMTSLDYESYGRVDVTLFMIVSICIPFCLYIEVWIYILLTLFWDGMVLSLFLFGGVDAAFNTNNLGDFLVFIGVQLILGVVIFYYKYSMREKLLEHEDQQKEIKQLNEAQNRFFSNMSHEIRTPINTIIGLNEMILRQNASEEINEDAENIEAASNMLLHLVNDILDMSKFESGQMKLNKNPYNTAEMLSDIVAMMWIRAREKKLSFHVDVSPELPTTLYGDEVRLKQVLINVINNAIKYTNEGTVLFSIQCWRDEDGNALMSYTVSDTGIGIRKESLPHLFTAFRRVDEDKNKYIEGTGLGLSIVKQFVDLMGGTVSVNSIYTKGTTFVIRVPQKIVNDEYVGELDMDNRNRPRAGYNHAETFEAPEARILVVDDSMENLMVAEKLLKGTRVQTDTASSGVEALKKTVEQSYHLILMDHKMPGMDGIECLHAIRNQTGGLCHESKIVALTANAGSDLQSLYAKEGFDGYLMKPVTGMELENTVLKFLPREIVKVTGTHAFEEVSVEWIRDHRKKARIMITTESVADLPTSLLKEYHIAEIPHMVKTEGGLFKDGLEIETNGLLSYMTDRNAFVETVSPSVEEHERFFSEQLDNADNIFHISISGEVEHSGYPAAREAAENFGNVTVFDSGHLSSGQGVMAIEAARLAEEGLDAEEITERLEKMKSRIHTSFIVDSMDFLVRQKQVGPGIGRFADAFMVHPVLTLRKGKMTVSRVYFGSREHAWKRYISTVFNVLGDIDKRMLFITYVGMTTKELEKVKKMVQKRIDFDKIYIKKASPAVAANCGPGTFGLLFYTEY